MNLPLTFPQANSKSFDMKGLMGMKHFSEDMRKLAHVTAMYGLNQTPEEKKTDIMRVNPIVMREDAFDVGSAATVLQCLRRGQPHLFSF